MFVGVWFLWSILFTRGPPPRLRKVPVEISQAWIKLSIKETNYNYVHYNLGRVSNKQLAYHWIRFSDQ